MGDQNCGSFALGFHAIRGRIPTDGNMRMFAAILTLALLGSQGSFATDLTSGCGTEKECFLVPEGCSGLACDFVVTWTPRGDLIDFVVRANVAGLGDNVWVSMGINPNPAMVASTVMDCVHYDGSIRTQLSYNLKATQNNVLQGEIQDSSDVLDRSHSGGRLAGGFLKCTLSRKAEYPHPIHTFYSLYSPNQYHLVVAKGVATGPSTKDINGVTWVISPSTYDFMAAADEN